MARRSDHGVAIRCYVDAARRWENRVRSIRHRLLLGEYDSDRAVAELAHRILASGELREPDWATPMSHQRHHATY